MDSKSINIESISNLCNNRLVISGLIFVLLFLSDSILPPLNENVYKIIKSTFIKVALLIIIVLIRKRSNFIAIILTIFVLMLFKSASKREKYIKDRSYKVYKVDPENEGK